MKLQFKVGDIVRVATHRHGSYQYGDTGVIIEARRNDPEWPYRVDFEGYTTPTPTVSTNSYAERDLKLVAPKKLKASDNTRKDFRTVGEKPQTRMLLDHFSDKRSITAVEAAALYRIRSLSRRIVDLTKGGHRFSKQHNVDPTGQRYVRYHYLGLSSGAVARC